MGDIVIAELSDRLGLVCKVYFREGNKVRLVSENRRYDTIVTDEGNLKAACKVIGAIRKR